MNESDERSHLFQLFAPRSERTIYCYDSSLIALRYLLPLKAKEVLGHLTFYCTPQCPMRMRVPWVLLSLQDRTTTIGIGSGGLASTLRWGGALMTLLFRHRLIVVVRIGLKVYCFSRG